MKRMASGAKWKKTSNMCDYFYGMILPAPREHQYPCSRFQREPDIWPPDGRAVICAS